MFLKPNARFSLPISSISLNSRNGKDHRLSRHRHHRCVRIRLLAIGTDGAQMTHPNQRREIVAFVARHVIPAIYEFVNSQLLVA
jgi:hypothetical protein